MRQQEKLRMLKNSYLFLHLDQFGPVLKFYLGLLKIVHHLQALFLEIRNQVGVFPALG